jgi:hypothetical protein
MQAPSIHHENNAWKPDKCPEKSEIAFGIAANQIVSWCLVRMRGALFSTKNNEKLSAVSFVEPRLR